MGRRRREPGPTERVTRSQLARVRHLVLDEVDEALQGSNLKPTVAVVDSFRDGRPLQLILASATADTPAVRRAAVQLLERPLLLRLLHDLHASRGALSASRRLDVLYPSRQLAHRRCI